jgi:hypothetical protein
MHANRLSGCWVGFRVYPLDGASQLSSDAESSVFFTSVSPGQTRVRVVSLWSALLLRNWLPLTMVR